MSNRLTQSRARISALLICSALMATTLGAAGLGLASSDSTKRIEPAPVTLASAASLRTDSAATRPGDEISTGGAAMTRATTTAAVLGKLAGEETGKVAQPAPVTNRRVAAEAAAALAQAGITPEKLAVCGGNIDTMHAALAGAIIQGSTDPNQLSQMRTGRALRQRAALDAYRAALTGQSATSSSVATGGEGAVGARGTANAPATGLSADDAAAMALPAPPAGEGILSVISPQVAARLAILNSNSKWNLPTRFLLTDRTDADWAALRDAWSAKRIAERKGRQIDDQTQAIIDAAENDPVAIAAKELARLHTDELGTAWAIVLGGN